MPTAAKPIPELTDDRKANFFRRIKINQDTGCHEWQATKTKGGYGQVSLFGRMFSVHRVAYFLATGNDPSGLDTCHTCDNPSCCNPDHLFIGTTSENMRDCAAKGRANKPRGDMNGARIHPETRCRGEAHWSCKLTAESVRAIRDSHSAGVRQNRLAAEFGVSTAVIGKVIHRATWRHVA